MSRHRRASHSNPIWRLVSALVGVVALVAAMAVTGSVASADTPASADGWTVTASVGLPIDGASSGDTPAALTTLAPGSTVDPGQALTYSLRVVNQTAVATAQPVTVVDQIDDLLASAAIATSADDLAKAGIIVDEKAGTLSWTPSPIAGGQYAETSFEVIVDKDAAAGTLTTAAAVDGATCKAGSPCATSLTVSGASSPDSDGNAMSSGPGDDASTSTAAPTTTSPAPTTSSSTSRGTGAGHSSRMGVNSLAGGVHPMDSSSASIVVHAGGVRTGDGTVSSLAGVKFQAERNGSVLGTCTTDSGGDCTISGADTDTTYDISQVGAPDGWYANPKLDRGDASTGHAADYVFRVRTGGSGSTVDVPGRNPDSSYSERGGSSNDSDGNPFLGLWATSRDDNPMPNVCGLNIALVMDESGSMGDKPSGSSDTKLSLLKTAAKGVVDALIPSTSTKIALYSFAQGTDKMSGLSHDASDLKSKINTLRASGGTNWDQGLYQVVKKRGSDVYDLVVVLTDGNPTQDHNGNGDNNRTRFDNVSNAIFSANAIKNMPNTQGGKTRLVAIGIGVNGGDENIRAISGTQLNSDYFLSSGSNFGDALKSTLLANCGLTVTKKVQDENGVQTPAQGWTITANTGTGNDNETTDSNGNAVFGPLPSGSVTFTITENQKSSYHVVPASGKNMTCVQGTHTLAVTNVGTDESGGKPGVTFTADPSDGGIHCTIVNSNVVANPPLPPKCGLNIALVLDLSGSISDHDFGTEKDAAIGVVKALKGTPSNVGLYTFASTAPAAGGPGGNSNVTGTDGDGVSVATDAGVTELVSAINGLDKPTFFEGYYTNWGQGLLQVESSHKYDAILFVTDGNPTTYGNGSDVSDFGKALNKGIAASEVIKGHGTRIIAVGVDSDGVGGGGGVSGLNADNLKAISGPTEYDGTNASTADWFTVDDWSKLGDALKSIATDTCKGTLTVVKELQTWDGQADGAGVGWTFSTSTDGVETQDGHQSSGETGSDGTLNFTVDYGDSDTSKDVHIAETQQDGYKLVQQDGFNATCTSDNEALGVTNDGDLGFSVEVKNDEVVTCTVINRAPAPIPHLTLVKKVQNYDTGGTAKPADWTLQASGAPDGFSGAGNSAAVTDQPVTQGATYTLSESGGPGGYSASQWACAGAATWSRADGTVTPAAGEDITCTITNTAIAPHLTLKKWAVDLDGNGAFSDQWTLTATDDASGDTPIAGTPTDADAGIGADVTAGVTYDLYESDGPTGYTPGDAWVCDGGKFASPDQIELGVGENVTCTMTNTKQFQPLTITKTVTASYDRTYEWNITKAVNKKEATVSGDEKATFHYTVTATPDGVTDHDWAMAGTITVGNPNDVDVTATVTDVPSVGGGATCAVADGVDATIPANGSKEFHYSCTIPSRPQYTGGTNTATVTWTRNSGGHVDTNPAVDVTFGLGNETNKTVHVTDDKTTGSQKPLGKATWTDGAATFQYDVEKQGTTGECVKYDNTAEISETGQLAKQSVQVCEPVATVAKSVTVTRAPGGPVGGDTLPVQPGDHLTWTITVHNPGSIPLTGQLFLDVIEDNVLNGTTFDPTVSGAFTVSPAGASVDVTYDTSNHTVTATTTGNGLGGSDTVEISYSGSVLGQDVLNAKGITTIDNTVIPTAPLTCAGDCSTHNPLTPTATVSKAVTVTRDGQDIGGSGTAVQPGDKLTWVLSVHNTGSVPYSGSALTDNLSSAIAGTDLSSSTVFTSSSPAQLSADTSGWPTLDVTATLLPPEHTETITYSAIVDSRADLSSAGITTIDNTIVAGDVPTCQSDCGTTNPVAPRLTLVKDVVNGSTGPATSPDWTLSATDSSGSAVIDAPGETNSTGPGAAVTAGTQYTLAEQPTYAGSDVTNGYTPSTWSCVNGNGQARYTLDGADISLGDGADVTCTITNTWHPVATTVKSVASTVQQADGSWTITYELSVTNPDTVLPATYTLTDTPGFGSGINITGATITDPAGGTGPAWDGAGTVVLAADRGLAAGANETWTVAIDAVVTAKATSTDLDCSTDHTPGSGFFNSATITSGPGGNDSTACSEPATPDVTKTFDGPATQNLDGDGNWDGSWTIPFTITVTNNSTDPSEPVLTYSLSDEPDFPGDVTVLGMTVTDSSVAGVVPGSYDGTTGVLTIVPADAAVPLAPGATDTFSIDVVAVVPAADDFGQDTCAQGSDASNLTNLATAHSGQSDYTAQDCGFLPPLPVPSVTKSVVSTVQQADGSWTVTYRVVVTNGSDSLATQYDVTDTLAYGAGISVNEASASGPGVNTSWDGVSDTDLAVGQFLSAGASAQYTVTVNADVASSTGTGPKPATQCQPGGPGEPGQPGGFGNNSHVGLAGAGVQQPQPEPLRGAAGALTEPDVRSGSQDAYACSEPATPDVTKTFVSAMQHAGADGKWDGTWDVTYTVTVSNPSADAALSYDLSDSPEFPADVTVNGGSVTGTASDGSAIDVKDGWNGTSATAIVTGRPLAAGDTDSYTVVVNATVPASITTDEATCSTDTGAGHGFFNTAAAVSGADTVTAEDCGDIPALPTPNVAKSVSSVTQNADGTWTVVYDLVVTNPSVDKSGTYDLDDTIAFGAGITVQSATVTGPDDATLNPSWTGADPNTSIVSGRIIGPHTQESYTVTVVAGVGSTSTATDRDCTLDSGESGTGFLNTATLAVGDHTSTSSACASPVSPTITKQVASVTAVGNGVSIVAYDVVVSNPSASTGLIYDLADTLGFPADVTVSDPHASWVRSALDGSGATASQDVPGWTGAGDGTTLATGQSLPAGSMDTYHVVVTATVPFSVPADQLDCLTPGGAGHGFFNEGAVTSGSDTLTASACADIPPTIEVLPTSSSIPPSTSSVPPSSTTTIPVSPTSSTIAYTGVNTLGMGWLAFLLLGAGALLLAAGAAWRRKPRRH